jgi:hypothetical protein
VPLEPPPFFHLLEGFDFFACAATENLKRESFLAIGGAAKAAPFQNFLRLSGTNEFVPSRIGEG